MAAINICVQRWMICWVIFSTRSQVMRCIENDLPRPYLQWLDFIGEFCRFSEKLSICLFLSS